eukprot:1674494-Lingulodinium_polyedra.AAC.1
MFGLDGMVDYILEIPGCNDFHLRGFKKLSEPDTREFTLICALAAYIPDAVLEAILEDNRAGRQLATWKELSKEE